MVHITRYSVCPARNTKSNPKLIIGMHLFKPTYYSLPEWILKGWYHFYLSAGNIFFRRRKFKQFPKIWLIPKQCTTTCQIIMAGADNIVFVQ